MIWDNDDDGEWMQRFKNGAFLKLWVTNETRDAAIPVMAVIALIGFVVLLVVAALRAWS